jgi:GDP-fucose transporter C1
LTPIVLLSGEVSEIWETIWFLGDLGFWFLMTVTGVAGFLINTAMFLQIKYTTALTNTISGTAKSCVQTLLAMVFYQNPITATVSLLFSCPKCCCFRTPDVVVVVFSALFAHAN